MDIFALYLLTSDQNKLEKIEDSAHMLNYLTIRSL
jgi:hypothetical protein